MLRAFRMPADVAVIGDDASDAVLAAVAFGRAAAEGAAVAAAAAVEPEGEVPRRTVSAAPSVGVSGVTARACCETADVALDAATVGDGVLVASGGMTSGLDDGRCNCSEGTLGSRPLGALVPTAAALAGRPVAADWPASVC
jgi:hypothetical protein